MKKNVGNVDRVIRVLLAVILGLLFLTGTVTGTLGIVFLVLGVVLLLTSLFSFCPLYYPFGIKTNKRTQKITS